MARKAFNFYRSYYDVAKELPEKDRAAFLWALLEKQFCNIEPSDLKGMAKLAYISQQHSINQQVKGYIDKTKDPLEPPYQPPSVQEKEEDKEKVKEEGKEKFNAFAFMCDLGYNESLVKEWFEVRKLKKLKNTETALTGFNNEVLKTNKPINEILKTCVEKSWGGFKNEWLTKEKESDNPLINAINQMYGK